MKNSEKRWRFGKRIENFLSFSRPAAVNWKALQRHLERRLRRTNGVSTDLAPRGVFEGPQVEATNELIRTRWTFLSVRRARSTLFREATVRSWSERSGKRVRWKSVLVSRRRRRETFYKVASPIVKFRVWESMGESRRETPVNSKHKKSSKASYLVDPASSHMLVSKIKPCMSKYKPH